MNRCPRCINGCLHYEQDDWGGPYVARCINCGARPYAPPVPEPHTRKGGAVLPVVTATGQMEEL